MLSLIAFGSALAAGAEYYRAQDEHRPYADHFTQFSQQGRTGVYPNLGLNLFHHPQSNLVNSYSKSKLPSQLREAHITKQLRSSAYTTRMGNNHMVLKDYKNRSIQASLGHFNGIASQGPAFGKHTTGWAVKRGYVDPRTHKTRQFNLTGHFGNNPDIHDGSVFPVTGKPQ